jgi:hypothetical protein
VLLDLGIESAHTEDRLLQDTLRDYDVPVDGGSGAPQAAAG